MSSDNDNKRGQHAKFRNEFGKSIKLGIIEDATNRNRLAKLLKLRREASLMAKPDKLLLNEAGLDFTCKVRWGGMHVWDINGKIFALQMERFLYFFTYYNGVRGKKQSQVAVGLLAMGTLNSLLALKKGAYLLKYGRMGLPLLSFEKLVACTGSYLATLVGASVIEYYDCKS